MNKKTKAKQTFNLKATIFSIIFVIIFIVILLKIFFSTNNIFILLICIFFLTLGGFGLLGSIIGFLKGKYNILKENKYIKNSNPYLYYRELPNNFGIGVTSLLFDSVIENYKDIVATILDLCAKKYLNLIKQNDKYTIKILKKPDDYLLSNEKYILSLLISNDIKNINYKEWYSLCLQDGINLGLYHPKNIKFNDNVSDTKIKIKKNRTLHLIISFVICVISFILSLSNGNILKSLTNGVFSFILVYIILIIPFYLINTIIGIKNIGKNIENINYKNIIENNLKKTKKGIEELHKLYSFKSFIKDFGNFVDKNVDEVVLWDRYLSYAQVFGLTTNIMNTGYKKLIDNASFQIDNIDNINLYNLEINMQSNEKN